MSQTNTISPVYTPASNIISSGPMSEGMLQVSHDRTRNNNDSTERVCLFSICLMFIGIPIIVLGIILLTILPLLGIILMVIGIVASTSGTFLAILSAILAMFIKTPTVTTAPENYTDGQTPDITIESDNYTEHFTNNLCEEPPQQLMATNLVTDINDKEFMTKLDPVYWSNYPEAQNPKSYLNSFGDLPKVMPSPEPSAHNKTKVNKSNKRDKYDDKIRRKISKTMKMGRNRRTISRTELTRDYSDEIQSTSSSSSSSSPETDRKASYFKINANEFGVNNKNSIITIENISHNIRTTDDNTTDSIAVIATRSSIDNTTNDNTDNELNIKAEDFDSNHMNVSNKTKYFDNYVEENDKEINCLESNSLSDECERIELTERLDSEADSGVSVAGQGGFDNLWQTVRERKSS